MAKQVREELYGGRRKRRRQEPQAPDPEEALEPERQEDESEAETPAVEAEAQEQQPEPEQPQAQEEEHEQRDQEEELALSQEAEPDELVEPQQAKEKPAPVQSAPALPTRPVLRHVSRQAARPSNQVLTVVPLDRLLPVQPVDVREFADWQSLRAYVSSYAQQTNQLYFVQAVVPVTTHNANILRSGSLEPQVPELLGVYSQIFGCIHGTGPQHFDLQRWGNTQCPAEIKAHVVRDWYGHWRVVISQQFAFHNHYVHQELIESYAQTRVRAEDMMTAATGPVGPALQVPHSTGNNAVTQHSPVLNHAQPPPRYMPLAQYKVAMQKQELTEIKKLDRNVVVPEANQFVFVDWPEFRTYMSAYGRTTFQHFQETESESVSTRNAMLLKNTKDEPPRLIPERFGTYSVLLRCIHHQTDTQANRHAPDTKCPAQIIACLKRDDASGAWHVATVQQVVNHNHYVNASVYARYVNDLQTPTPVAGADAEVIDLTEDQATSEQDIRIQQNNAMLPEDSPTSNLQESSAYAPESRNETHIHEEVEDEDLGRCESNDEATEVEQLDHLIRVRPMRQRVFPDWNALSDYLATYTRSTHQLYSVRTATPASTRNAKIMEQKYARPELLIPERFEHYVRTWQCVHSGINRPRPQNMGKRPNQRYRTMNCPAQVNACVKRQGHSGVWEVVITNQNALHNHHINKTIFKSYVENRRITDPALLNGIMRLHFQGVKCKGVMEYIHKHSDIEPKPKDVHNLIRKLVQAGWTAERCAEDTEETTSEMPPLQEECGANGDGSRANSQSSTSNRNENERPGDPQTNRPTSSHEERPHIDSALLADIQKLATAGASGQQILDFISSQAVDKP